MWHGQIVVAAESNPERITMSVSNWIGLGCASMILSVIIGCAGRPALFPNSDTNLRKTSAQFAADSARRFPYPAYIPSGTAKGVAAVDVQLDTVQLTNQSDEDWTNIDVWLNKAYVVHVPKIEAKRGLRTLNFQMFFNDKGDSFPTNNLKHPVNTIEIVMNEKLWTVKNKLAE